MHAQLPCGGPEWIREKMARKRGTGVHGLFSRALYLTVAQKLPEGTFEKIWTKHAELEKLK